MTKLNKTSRFHHRGQVKQIVQKTNLYDINIHKQSSFIHDSSGVSIEYLVKIKSSQRAAFN